MRIEDIIVKIKLASDEQKQKGMLGFAKIKIPSDFEGYGKKYIVIKGIMVWGRSQFHDGVKGYCSVSPPCQPKAGRKPFYLVFFEDENFDRDDVFWKALSGYILMTYYNTVDHREESNNRL